MQPLRSLLFVPGNKPTWMEKALGYGADALIFDLEDSVPALDKRFARAHVRQALERLHGRGPCLTVRINVLDTGLAGDDLEAIICPGLSAIIAPKIETPQEVAVIDTLLTQGEGHAGMAQRVCQPYVGQLAREVTPHARSAICGVRPARKRCISALRCCSKPVLLEWPTP